MTHLVGLDPGRSKCGLVLVDLPSTQVLSGVVLSCADVLPQLCDWQQNGGLDHIVLGNGTSHQNWNKALRTLAPVHVVNERGTTLRARQRYWQLWPAVGLRRLLPEGLRVPPIDLDAVAALVMVEVHHQIRCVWPGPPPRPQPIKSGHVP